jgi:hypothetical protein
MKPYVVMASKASPTGPREGRTLGCCRPGASSCLPGLRGCGLARGIPGPSPAPGLPVGSFCPSWRVMTVVRLVLAPRAPLTCAFGHRYYPPSRRTGWGAGPGSGPIYIPCTREPPAVTPCGPLVPDRPGSGRRCCPDSVRMRPVFARAVRHKHPQSHRRPVREGLGAGPGNRHRGWCGPCAGRAPLGPARTPRSRSYGLGGRLFRRGAGVDAELLQVLTLGGDGAGLLRRPGGESRVGSDQGH